MAAQRYNRSPLPARRNWQMLQDSPKNKAKISPGVTGRNLKSIRDPHSSRGLEKVNKLLSVLLFTLAF